MPELPAKKIWSWGVDADGLGLAQCAFGQRQRLLLRFKEDSFRDQETYAFLEPRQTINFSEYWMAGSSNRRYFPRQSRREY